MRRLRISGKHPCYRAVDIERHIDDEVMACFPRDLEELVMERIVIDRALTAGRILQEKRAVKGLDGQLTRTPRSDEFPAP